MIDALLPELARFNTWIELSQDALQHNVAFFKARMGNCHQLMTIVKANAYGHGMDQIAEMALDAGTDWLGVFSMNEAHRLRDAGFACPILVLGPTTTAEQIGQAAAADISLTIGSVWGAQMLQSTTLNKPLRVHLKLETGTHRQGLDPVELPAVAQMLQQCNVEIEGAYTHYADIEDTTDHQFAKTQLAAFSSSLELLAKAGIHPPLPHTACTAAAILFSKTYFAMARVGIGTYGLWPSGETKVSAQMQGERDIELQPVMTWKTRIAQLKKIKAGDYVGYGRSFRAVRDSHIGILPVGYADGYDRSFSNSAHTLVRGQRAPVTGRICMNLTMIDVTDVPGVAENDEVILLGKSSDEQITAEDLARIAGTINYEIVTRAAPGAPRLIV